VDTVELTSTPVVVARGVLTSDAYGVGDFAVSQNGTLVFVPGTPEMHFRKLVWIGDGDRRELLDTGSHNFQSVRFSPDGAHLALSATEGSDDVWTYELRRGTMVRLTNEWDNTGGNWTADGRLVVYRSLRPGATGFYVARVDGTAVEEYLFDTNNAAVQQDVSRDDVLVYMSGGDLWSVQLGSNQKPEKFLATDFRITKPAFSPDGKWLAYTSDESGRVDVYIRPFPGPGPRHLVSTEGGRLPSWHPNGQELVYAAGDELFSVRVVLEPAPEISAPRALYEVPGLVDYDIAPDGRFLVIQDDPSEKPTEIQVVLNWFEELKQKTSP
jgi:serine/threonine-protein kinase